MQMWLHRIHTHFERSRLLRFGALVSSEFPSCPFGFFWILLSEFSCPGNWKLSSKSKLVLVHLFCQEHSHKLKPVIYSEFAPQMSGPGTMLIPYHVFLESSVNCSGIMIWAHPQQSVLIPVVTRTVSMIYLSWSRNSFSNRSYCSLVHPCR